MIATEHPLLEELIAYAQGRLSKLSADMIEQHLSSCVSCLNQVESAPDDPVMLRLRAVVPHQEKTAQARTHTEYRGLTHFAKGGLGEILLAHDHLVGRDVAVKRLLQATSQTSEYRQRFLREAIITGRLEHPGIAPVYGIGQDESGQPCYAMRFVPGKTLRDALLEMHSHPCVSATMLRPLLNRVIALCGTVAYAHSRGVIHRDIKPDNVAIGSFGETILLDWGLAQTDDLTTMAPTTGDSTETASITQLRTAKLDVMGTPGFMAPEQQTGNTVGPSADVYSLGITLRCVLTGQHLPRVSPFPALDAIVVRATAHEPESRYPNAMELAADIERWLADEPVSVFRDSIKTRIWRFLRRNQTLAISTMILLLTTTIALAVGAVLLQQEKQRTWKALQAEEVHRQQAVTAEAETASMLQFVDQYIFSAGRPKGREGGLGREVTLAHAVSHAANSVETSFAGHPITEARVRSMLGTTLLSLGDSRAAELNFLTARKLFELHLGPDDASTLKAMNNLANCYRQRGKLKEALDLDETVANRRREILGEDHPETLRSMHNLANSYAALGKIESALQLDQQVYAQRLAILGPEHDDTMMSMASLASSYFHNKRDKEALKLYEEVFYRRLSKYGKEHAFTITAMNNLANIFAEVGRHEEAYKMRLEVLTLMRANSGPQHADTLMAMNNLARSYSALKKFADALALHQEVFKLRQETLSVDHSDTLISRYNIAITLLDLNRGPEAIKEFDSIVQLATGKAVNPQLIPVILEKRSKYFAKVPNVSECRKSAETWIKLMPESTDALVQAARLWALADDGDQAMHWLSKAVANGYQDRNELETDGDFAVLRTRQDYQQMVKSFAHPKN